jgi:hypothetical protein
MKELCHAQTICRHFAKARQECAVAGDLNNCVRVKVGDEMDSTWAICANDGSIDTQIEVTGRAISLVSEVDPSRARIEPDATSPQAESSLLPSLGGRSPISRPVVTCCGFTTRSI